MLVLLLPLPNPLAAEKVEGEDAGKSTEELLTQDLGPTAKNQEVFKMRQEKL